MDEDNQQEVISVSMDEYYGFGLSMDKDISDELYQKIHETTRVSKAYQSCLRKLSVHDRSAKELRDWLYEHTECNTSEINQIIRKLSSLGYIDDERFTSEWIQKQRASLFGNQRIEQDLLKKGISSEMIHQYLSKNDDEYERGVKFAEKIKNHRGNRSMTEQKKYVHTRLLQKGYHRSVTERILSSIQFDDNIEQERILLAKSIKKARKMYEKKYHGSELRNRIYRYCASHGYHSSDILTVLESMEFNDDEY